MKNITLIAFLATIFVGCTDNGDNQGEQGLAMNKTYSTEAEAEANSPVGLSCLVSGEYKEVTECVPTNRGKNGNCENRTVVYDTRIWESAYLRGDVDGDGIAFTRDDAQLATKRIYVKQIEKAECPAVADIAPFEGVNSPFIFEADSYFTSNDINGWRLVKRGQGPSTMGTVCQSACKIINHMSPEYK